MPSITGKRARSGWAERRAASGSPGDQRRRAAGGEDGRILRLLRAREIFQEARRQGGAVEKGVDFGLGGQQCGLGVGFILHLALEQSGGLHEDVDLAVHRVGEPAVHAVAQHFEAEQHQAEDRAELSASAPMTSLVRMREPGWLAPRQYTAAPVRGTE